MLIYQYIYYIDYYYLYVLTDFFGRSVDFRGFDGD